MTLSRRRRLAYVAAAALAALLLAAPAQSQAPTLVSIVAVDNAFRTDTGGAPNVTVVAGGHVNFSYFMGNSEHNVVFTDRLPEVCGISFGPPGTSVALPSVPSRATWEGGCEFETPGTYPFVCGMHSSMTGSVTVVAAGAAPPPGTAPPPGAAPSDELTQGPPPALAGGPAASGLKVAAQQRGFSVRGSVLVARAGSGVLARAFVRRRAVYGGRSARQVQVGRQQRSGVADGRVKFAAALNPAARQALRRNGRLSVSLRLTVTPPEGNAYTATRTVVLRSR